jgi:hypothetical protein
MRQTLQVNGRPATVDVSKGQIVTPGVLSPQGALDPLQQAFIDEQAVQCQSGIIRTQDTRQIARSMAPIPLHVTIWMNWRTPLAEAAAVDTREPKSGQRLFSDTRLSDDGTLSCASLYRLNDAVVALMKYQTPCGVLAEQDVGDIAESLGRPTGDYAGRPLANTQSASR